MMDNFQLNPVKIQFLLEMEELQKCNELSVKFGLTLTDAQIQNLMERRFEALKSTGRIEFGEGILKKLIYAFCDSPYILQEDYENTLIELQDSFYYFKNESKDLISDDELIEFMKELFDGRAKGSLDYLTGASLTDLCRNTSYDYRIGDKYPYEHE